jgi:sulfur-oxidizing protein SoxY
MTDAWIGPRFTRRAVLGAAGLAGIVAVAPRQALADEEEVSLLTGLFGAMPALSDRVRLDMPPKFSTGYTVPLDLTVIGPMTDTDYARSVHVLAPRNPLLRVAIFHFTPANGEARVSTRIRLAQPQNVIAVAEMSGGPLLMARTWVEVESDGCA